MKKSLLFGLILLAGLFSAQVFINENFETMTASNVGTDYAGTVAGQNGWYTLITSGSTNASNTSFQVLNGASGNTSKVLQVIGSNAASGSRFMYKDVSSQWASRTSGNDVVQVTYSFYTGSATTSTNQLRVVLYNSDKTKILAGLTFYQNTKAIRPLAYYDATSSGGSITNYSFYLGASNTDLILPSDTWVNVGFTFDYATGDVTWKVPGSYSYLTGASASVDPVTANIYVAAGTSNALAATNLYDNFKLEAVAIEDLATALAVKDYSSKVELSVYPNPATDVLNINSQSKVKSVNVYDATGKKANVTLQDKQVDVRNLAKGVYILNVTTENGTESVKFIKK